MNSVLILKHYQNDTEKRRGIKNGAVDSVKVLLSECSLPCVRLNQDPRIRFEAEVEFAKALRKEVLADARREQPALYAPWDILVAKEDVLRTVFELSCAEYLEESKRHYRHPEHYAALGLFRPENLVNDFAALTEYGECSRSTGGPAKKRWHHA